MSKPKKPKSLAASLATAAKDTLNAATDNSVQELYDITMRHPLMSHIDSAALLREAVHAAVDKEISNRTRPPPIDPSAPTQVEMLFGGEWGESGMCHQGHFVKNRHANRQHNRARVTAVKTNAANVVASAEIEVKRFDWLEIAYEAVPEIQTNEEAITWLRYHEIEPPSSRRADDDQPSAPA